MLNAQTQSLNEIPLSVDNSSEVVTNAAKSPKKPTVDSTLIKLKDIEKMIQGLKNELKKEIIDSIRSLPTIVNSQLQEELIGKTAEIDLLQEQLSTAITDKTQATKESKHSKRYIAYSSYFSSSAFFVKSTILKFSIC